ncbi:MAG: sigma-70 family RNA polymerase sigma factor [Nocardioidaceae bacterium]
MELEAFCHREHARLVRLLSLHCGDVETAKDLTQETLLRVCLHWRKVRRMDVPEAWVTRVASISLPRRTDARPLSDGLPVSSNAPGHAHDGSVDGGAVRSAVASLPERQRTALILRYYEDLPVNQVAVLMGVSPSAVKKLSAKAVARLRDLLGNDIVEVTDA